MASTSHNSSPHGSVKYNHFHEYDSDVEELFEIREMTTSPEPIAIVPVEGAAPTRVAKLKQAIGISLLRKRSQRKTGDEEAERRESLSRPSKEREEYLRDLADQMFGRGKYSCEPKPKDLYEEHDPKTFTAATFPRRAKSVRWKSESEIHNVQNVRFMDTAPKAETMTVHAIKCHERQKSRGDNPDWLQEFELPEPTLTNPLESKRDSNLEDHFHIKELFADKSRSPPAEISSPSISPSRTKLPQSTTCETVPDEDSDTNWTLQAHDASLPPSPPPKESQTKIGAEAPSPPIYAPWKCKCGRPTCTKTSVHTLTEEGVRSSLGRDVADSIAKELLARVGLPPPPPLKNPLAEEEFFVREKEAVENYATWAAICLFQKLVLSIKMSLEPFKPNHRGVISFDFANLDPKARYLVTVEMANIFNGCVKVLHDIRPLDVEFRKKIMGRGFWAQGQEYRIIPTGSYNGILLDYRIKRGGPDFKTKHLAKGGRATL